MQSRWPLSLGVRLWVGGTEQKVNRTHGHGQQHSDWGEGGIMGLNHNEKSTIKNKRIRKCS